MHAAGSVLQRFYLASAGDIGGMIGKKFGFGISLALPVMRQNDDIVNHFLFKFLLIFFFHSHNQLSVFFLSFYFYYQFNQIHVWMCIYRNTSVPSCLVDPYTQLTTNCAHTHTHTTCKGALNIAHRKGKQPYNIQKRK